MNRIESARDTGSFPGVTLPLPADDGEIAELLRWIERLEARRVRLLLSGQEQPAPPSREVLSALLPPLAEKAEVLACIAPTAEKGDLEDLLEELTVAHGRFFDGVELRFRPALPGRHGEWRPPALQIKPYLRGVKALQERGKWGVLSGFGPEDLLLLERMCREGSLSGFRAVGLSAVPGTQASSLAAAARNLLLEYGCPQPLWVTETGAGRKGPLGAVEELLGCFAADIDRVYWSGPSREQRAPASHTLPLRLYVRGGAGALEDLVEKNLRRCRLGKRQTAVITGGAGFIGTNLCDRLAAEGHRVIVLDNLSRPGVEENLEWLCRRHGDRIDVETADLVDEGALRRSVADAGAVFHLAAQVAVTTSVEAPREDFAVNARGTLNLLEALRSRSAPPPLIFTSTNKVYGKLSGCCFVEGENAYTLADPLLAVRGIPEGQPLDFYSPYGCSKGAADQYVADYARIYNLPTVVFRMSCIYGPHQRGTEDQGWVAHFLIRALRGERITLFGNGKQVRDILFIDDLVEAFLAARSRIGDLAGQVFNIGGGPARATSLLDLLKLIETLNGRAPRLDFGPWRPGDQPWYVSDTSRFREATGWEAKTEIRTGVQKLHEWLQSRYAPERLSGAGSGTKVASL